MVFSIIQKSQLEGIDRLDAEYYQPEYLANDLKLDKYGKLIKLADCASVVPGPAYSSSEMKENLEIPLARIGDVTGKTDIDDWIGLSNKEFEKFGSRRVRESEIIMTMTGDPPDVGKVNIISGQSDKILAFNQRVAKLVPKIDPFYLFAYLSTQTARLQSERNAFGIRQRNLSTPDLRDSLVVTPNPEKQKAISKMIKDYLAKLENAKDFYQQAENLLTNELGLKDFRIPEELSYVVDYSDVEKINRVDADYFQPKYKALLSKIREYNPKLLSELILMKKGFEPGSEKYLGEGRLFIRVSSLSKNGTEEKDQKYLSEELYQKLKDDFEPKVGEILLTKDATPGVAYVVKEPIEGVISGGILSLKIKTDIEPEYLALCINSIVGRMQAERDSGGSVIIHWKPDQIRNLVIPILPNATQQEIASLVKKSHEARKKSKVLLEEAKSKVEEIIEKGGD